MSCVTCGGLIMEPGKSYCYGGPVCTCMYPTTNKVNQFYQGQQLGGLSQAYIDPNSRILCEILEALKRIEEKLI